MTIWAMILFFIHFHIGCDCDVMMCDILHYHIFLWSYFIMLFFYDVLRNDIIFELLRDATESTWRVNGHHPCYLNYLLTISTFTLETMLIMLDQPPIHLSLNYSPVPSWLIMKCNITHQVYILFQPFISNWLETYTFPVIVKSLPLVRLSPQLWRLLIIRSDRR